MMIDTHAHVDMDSYDEDRESTIQRALDSGKPACVNVIMDQEPPGIMGGYEFM